MVVNGRALRLRRVVAEGGCGLVFLATDSASARAVPLLLLRAMAAATVETPAAAAAAPGLFRSPSWLRAHARDVCLGFWLRSPRPRASGGAFFHCLRDDGSVYDARTRHLVSSTRLVVQCAWAVSQGLAPPEAPAPGWRELMGGCLHFLRERHFVAATGGYRWVVLVDGDEAEGAAPAAGPGQSPPPPSEAADDTNRSYGLCFALLAYASALAAGAAEARAMLDEVTETLSRRFWSEEHGLYADEASADWSALSPYRGQNANMHAVEAHMAAFRATRGALHLARARRIAHAMCVVQAARVDAATGLGELVYEHYAEDWSAPDLRFNRDRPDDRFRPFGFQPGHLLEWAKLLVQLDALDAPDAPDAPDAGGAAPAGWRLGAARRFFAAALKGWDEGAGRGGFAYSLSPEPGLPVLNARKYKWVQCEGAAAAALLAHAPGVGAEERAFFLAWYERIWRLCEERFVDRARGSWFRVLEADLSAVDDRKCPPGKVDYHATGLCYDAADAFEAAEKAQA